MTKLSKRFLYAIIIIMIISLFIPSCFQFDAPVDADFDVQECALLRDLNEGEDAWFHCRDQNTDNEIKTEDSELKKEGTLCCLSSECVTSLCVCGQCMTHDSLL